MSPATFLIFFAWIPLIWLESVVSRKRVFFGYTYIVMFTWNVLTTWWIWNASVPGSIGAFVANSFLMCLPWLGYKVVRGRFGELNGYLALIVFWMGFEFIHLNDWGLSWPWLTLGNAFAGHPEWVQWYEYTGTSGGTLWILVMNILLFLHIRNNYLREGQRQYKHLGFAMALLLLPLGISFVNAADSRTALPAAKNRVVVVQPNIDPYQKISDITGSFDAQLQKLIALSEKAIDDSTTLVVWPETALYMGNGIDELQMRSNRFLDPLWAFLQRHPRLQLFTGIESYRVYDKKATPTAREATGGFFYDVFNGSVVVDSSGPLAYYHKSMLVPGVETLPWFLKFIDSWFEKFGGTTAGYARQAERTVLPAGGFSIAPAICYESIYGEFMGRYVDKGASLICIITNDGWWGNTPGYKQHMSYARLRAVETRRWVARSANTGISCFIDPMGTVRDYRPWDKADALKLAIPAETVKTFYVRHGDLLSRVALIISGFLIGWTLISAIRKKWFPQPKPA